MMRLHQMTQAVWFFPLLMPGADRPPVPVQSSNEAVYLKAAVAVDKREVEDLIGIDPGMQLVAVSVTLRPAGDDPVNVSREDFTLISRRDGQKSQGMHPSQIAGSGALVFTSRGPQTVGGFGSPRRGPIWGGVPGTGTRPQRVGGDQDVAVGASGAESSTTKSRDDDENPLLEALKGHELRQGTAHYPVSGLIYFILDGKHKRKDLELMYKGPGGTLMLDFEK